MAVNGVGHKFENDLQKAFKESLALFPMDKLKAEQRRIIEKIVARRDVFGQLPMGYDNSLTFQLLPGFVGVAVASWLVHSTPERAVWVLALAGDIVLCSWARHFTLTVPLSTQVYKWVPANLMLGGNPAMD